MRAIILVLGIVVILGIGMFWLYARPAPAAPQIAAQQIEGQSLPTSKPSATPTFAGDIDQTGTTANVTSAAATTSHSIDWVSISPSSIASGAGTPITVTAQISDPSVIRSSVNLIYVSPTGTTQLVGVLNDNGLDGDAVANDNIFRIVSSFAQYPAGTVNLRISAAFSGSLLRMQTGLFQLNVSPPVSTAGWVTLTDSQRLFSIQVPSTWGLVVAETPGDDPGTVKTIYFQFSDGTTVFTISVNTTSSWAAAQSGYSQGPLPVFLGQNSQYVFGVSGTQVPLLGEPVSAGEVAQTLPQVFATFQVF